MSNPALWWARLIRFDRADLGADAALARLAAANMKQSQPLKGFWIILALAVMIGSSAVVVGSTLEAPPSADDKRIFFVIGAGLLAIVLFLIAEAWRFLTIKRGGD